MAGNGEYGRTDRGGDINMWLGGFVGRLQGAIEDIDAQNYGMAKESLTILVNEVAQNGITIHVKCDMEEVERT